MYFVKLWCFYFIAVCTYRLVMISIERSETAQKSTLEIRDNSVRDKIQSENFGLGLHTAVVFRMQSFNFTVHVL